MTSQATAPPADPLRQALHTSRDRWRDLAMLACDFAFETDSRGHLTFIHPDPALGWPSEALLDQRADILLAAGPAEGGFNPFAAGTTASGRRAWLNRPQGGSICLAFSVTPLVDQAGQPAGLRGIGHDMTTRDQAERAAAAALCQKRMLDHLLARIHTEVMAPRMMRNALEGLAAATGAAGCMVLDLLGDGVNASVLHHVNEPDPDLLGTALTLLEDSNDGRSLHVLSGSDAKGHPVLVCPLNTSFGGPVGLILWREPHSPAWDDAHQALASATRGIIRIILEQEAVQREMSRQARTDPLTGLLNRGAFLDEIARRLERLNRDDLPATLLFVDLDHFKSLNDLHGHDSGDDALCITAELLRDTVRPTDLVARFGGDEFALWLDGADEFTAAERADHLHTHAAAALAHLADPGTFRLSMSIGIATRWPAGSETIEDLFQRADVAMYQAKRAGRGQWRVWRPEVAS